MAKCRKRRFRDDISAKLAIATIQHKDNTGRPKTECRAYKCNFCKGWHITSEPIYEKKAS